MGVLLLLAGILLPAMNSSRRRSKRIQCVNNLKNVGVAFQAYLGESNGVMPSIAEMPSLGLNSLPRLPDVLLPNLGSTGPLRCPSDTNPREDTQKTYFESEGTSYQYNGHLSGRMVEKTFLGKKYGTSKVFVAFDYEPFHGKAGSKGAANYLFADGHVGDLGD